MYLYALYAHVCVYAFLLLPFLLKVTNLNAFFFFLWWRVSSKEMQLFLSNFFLSFLPFFYFIYLLFLFFSFIILLREVEVSHVALFSCEELLVWIKSFTGGWGPTNVLWHQTDSILVIDRMEKRAQEGGSRWFGIDKTWAF